MGISYIRKNALDYQIFPEVAFGTDQAELWGTTGDGKWEMGDE